MSEVKLGYGYDFQVRVLYLLMNDRSFFVSISSILYPSYFDNELIAWAVDTIIKYHKKEKIIITRSSLDVAFEDCKSPFKKGDYLKLMDHVEEVSKERDLQFTSEKMLDFCKRQNMKDAIFKSADLLSKHTVEDIDTYDKIISLMKKAVTAGEIIDQGYNYTAEVDRRYEEDSRFPIPTRWDLINKYMDGGLAKGELGVFVCPPKGGKSWLMVDTASYAAEQGFNVLFITLELSDSYVGRRFDAKITGRPVNEMPLYRDLIKQKIEEKNLYDRIKIRKMNRPTIYNIENFIDSLIESGFKPDIIFIDYADLIRGDKSELRMNLKQVYEDLRAMSDIYEAPVWTASQSNRQSTNAQIVTKDLISEDFSKIMTADFILSLSSHDLFHVMANRFGQDDITIESGIIDKSYGHFEMLGVVSLDDMKTQVSGSSGVDYEIGKKALASLFPKT